MTIQKVHTGLLVGNEIDNETEINDTPVSSETITEGFTLPDLQDGLAVADAFRGPMAFSPIMESVQDALIERSIASHRSNGYGGEANSLEAIEAALQSNENMIVIDLRIQDGQVIVSHDPHEEGQVVEAEEALRLFAEHPNATLLLDLKGSGDVVAELAKIINEIDAANADNPDYLPLAERSAFLAFDPRLLQQANEHFPQAPLVLHYFPLEGNTTLSFAASAYERGFGRSAFEKFIPELQHVDLHIRHDSPLSVEADRESQYAYDRLPPEEVIDLLASEEHTGVISVPYFAIKNNPEFFKELIEEAHEQGLSVGVWGLTDPEKSLDRHNQELARIIEEYEIQIITTDSPQVIDETYQQEEFVTVEE